MEVRITSKIGKKNWNWHMSFYDSNDFICDMLETVSCRLMLKLESVMQSELHWRWTDLYSESFREHQLLIGGVFL